MQRKWKPGDLVTVVTINQGLPGHSDPRGRKAADKTEEWAGKIVGPSLLGPGWWNVRRDTPSGSKLGSGVYAVPDGEIRPRKR